MRKTKFIAIIISIILVSVVVIPIAINESYKHGVVYVTKWDAADVLSYYGTLVSASATMMTIIGTILFTRKQIQRDRFLERNQEKWEKVDKVITQALITISPLNLRATGNMDTPNGMIHNRIETYFDEFLIDEVQDIAGRDFSLLEMLMEAKVNMLFVGDFFQHTYDTSRDGNMNKSLFKNKATYESRFVRRGFIIDSTTLVKSWRCSKSICDFVNKQLGICIASNRGPNDDTSVTLVTDPDNVSQILDNRHIVKLHYQMSSRYGDGHKNWGDTKGEDCYQDVCVMLNRTTAAKFKKGQLQTLPPATRNRLYVAITRAHGKCFFIIEK